MTISSQRRPSPFLAQVWHFLKSWDFGWLGSGFGTLPGRPLVFKHREKRPSGWGVERFDPWNPILHLFSKTMGKHQPPKSRKNIKLFCRWRIQEVLLKDVVIQKSCHWKEKGGSLFCCQDMGVRSRVVPHFFAGIKPCECTVVLRDFS